MSPLLNTYLGNCYAADVLGKGKLSDAIDAFKTALGLNASLRGEAVAEQSRLSGLNDNRCFISRKHLLYFQAVL